MEMMRYVNKPYHQKTEVKCLLLEKMLKEFVTKTEKRQLRVHS